MPTDHYLPWPLRLINGIGGLAGRGWPALRVDRIWDQVAAAVDDPRPFPEAREALGVLLDHANAAPLSPVGRLSLKATLPVALEQLLRVRKAVPDPGAPIAPPVFIAALPRTGTTLLQQLLSLHSGARSPRMWELLRPWPAPREPPAEADAARIALAEKMAADARRTMPALDRIHPLNATAPDECYYLLAHTACCAAFDAQLPVRGYTRWFLERDLRWTYEHHRRSLILLQRHVEGAFWLLKTPLHLFGLDALAAIYPDARLIVTHRDPVEAVPSCCSLYEAARTVYVRAVDPATLGPPWLETWGTATERAAAALQTWPADRVVHIAYADLVRDPVATIDAVLTSLRLPEDGALPDRVARWIADPAHRKDRHGAHEYTLERYGLAPGSVAERFSGWRAPA